MMAAAVEFSPLGLSHIEFSGSAAVDWNSVFIVATLGGRAPGGPETKRQSKNFPIPHNDS